MDWFDQLQIFMPYGMCLLWQPGLMFLHIASDALIALSYFAIPFGIDCSDNAVSTHKQESARLRVSHVTG